VARPASTLDLPLHTYLGVLAQRRRKLLCQRRLKRGVFRSVDDFKDAINCRIAAPAAFPGRLN
jgi:hypothetical protein